jgi:hypothetical protein
MERRHTVHVESLVVGLSSDKEIGSRGTEIPPFTYNGSLTSSLAFPNPRYLNIEIEHQERKLGDLK